MIEGQREEYFDTVKSEIVQNSLLFFLIYIIYIFIITIFLQ